MLAWILYVLQLLGSAVAVLVSLFSVFLTDSCGSSPTDPAVCGTGYLGAVLIGFWTVVAGLAVGVPAGLVISTRRRTARWPWAVGGLVLTVAATLMFAVLVTR